MNPPRCTIETEGETYEAHVQLHLKKIDFGDKVHFLVTYFKSDTFIYFRFITCKVKHFLF